MGGYPLASYKRVSFIKKRVSAKFLRKDLLLATLHGSGMASLWGDFFSKVYWTSSTFAKKTQREANPLLWRVAPEQTTNKIFVNISFEKFLIYKYSCVVVQ